MAATATNSNAGKKAGVDQGAIAIGAVYAKAFLGAAGQAKKTDALIAEFDSFVNDVLAKLPKLEAVLASGVVAVEDKLVILKKALAAQASPMFLNFLKVVANHGRLDALRAIYQAVQEQHAAAQNLIPVELITASPVDEALATRIAQSIARVVGGTPVLKRVVQPDLIGGMVLRVGDTLYDASVATQLEKVRGQMINRSVHEIQSRRDRFRNSEGS